ncbi:MAG: type III-B CRISPR module RAMP protein Cmr6 [Serpentinimonas sp.]|nr:type III-B CRISPR module RAMP protein Cmr6 [Serpentinimonas sp.]MDO9611086.1 type III-B CRISPR module RAMP protein Cmr6 [Serpentinimonas sp.]
MPIAAVPEYLGQDFSKASPGLRFGMYLPIWGTDQRSNGALQQACALSADDKRISKALCQRQAQLFNHTPTAQGLRLYATAVAPFTTGLGIEHPLENGFAFLNPYGLPYLPGSGVKGVLRQAALDLAGGAWETSDWSLDQRHIILDRAGKRLFDASDIDVLFGREPQEGDTQHLRGVLSFWDVIPQIEGSSLMVDIMTPHQSHYYQQKPAAGSTNPHDSGAPNPIGFLTVPPKSQFAFHVVCDCPRLERLAPDLAANERWKALLTQAFEHAFTWLGFGAKTAVGYGALSRNTQAEADEAQAQVQAHAAAEQAAKMASLSANERQIAAFAQACQSRFEQLRGSRENPNTEIHAKARALAKAALEGPDDWTADEKHAAAAALAEWVPKVVNVDWKDERKKLKLAVLKGEA